MTTVMRRSDQVPGDVMMIRRMVMMMVVMVMMMSRIGRCCCCRGRRSRRRCVVTRIAVAVTGLLPLAVLLVLHPPVLEPYLHLPLR